MSAAQDMTAFFNEIEPYPAQWMRNLMAAGHIAPGVVDERSIKTLNADDVRHATQAHFFAGIGVWSYALRAAGWPDDRPVWTGSCPCQPFSSAGRRAGTADERHLWPDWFDLIRECRPPVVLGEQVASRDGLAWLDTVQADMEGAGYAFAAFDLCAAGFGAPHVRQRIYFAAVGDADTSCFRDAGLSQTSGASEVRPWWAFGEVDLLEIVRNPFSDGARHHQPLVRSMDDGAPARVGRLCAYGNAIVAPQAVEFIRAVMEFLR